jgi:hypothetical protein
MAETLSEFLARILDQLSICPSLPSMAGMATENGYCKLQQGPPKGRPPSLTWQFVLVGRGGFEPPKAVPADLQSAPPNSTGLHTTL